MEYSVINLKKNMFQEVYVWSLFTEDIGYMQSFSQRLTEISNERKQIWNGWLSNPIAVSSPRMKSQISRKALNGQ